MKETHRLDTSKPYAEIHGGDDNSDAQPRFEQNGQHFDAAKKHIGAADGIKPLPEAEAKVAGLTTGEGNLAHGDIPKALLPIEEGGAGGGMTKSYPQTTDKGKDILDEEASDAEAAKGSKGKK